MNHRVRAGTPQCPECGSRKVFTRPGEHEGVRQLISGCIECGLYGQPLAFGVTKALMDKTAAKHTRAARKRRGF